ncbi:MAG: alpha/beta hydrolase [Rhodobacteraceae bacterium]|nr:alpha/beta hydrolase [Paracoccaceae bacterium]
MTPLVLVHGFMGGSAQWALQCRELGKTRDIVALDLPGFGDNAHLPPIDRIEGFADWVIDRLRTQGIKRYHLLGHSMGGTIVQDIALKDAQHIDRLILYATGSIGVLPGRFESIATSKSRAQEDGAPATARRIAATWFLDRDAAPAYPPCAAIAEKAGLPAIVAGLDAMEAWSGAARLPEICAETLVIWGDRDRTYPWAQIERLWQDIPKTRLAVIPGAAHTVHLEKPFLFNPVILDFLRP